MRLFLGAFVIVLLTFWAYQDRRELMIHFMTWSGSGAPPPLLDATDEGPNVRWLDDYFTVEEVAPNTFAIGEPRYAQQNYSYLIIGQKMAVLFDAGPGVRDIRTAAQSLTDKPITFLPSHFHYDHVGNEITFDNIAVVDLPSLRARAQDNQLTLTTMEHLGAAEGFSAPTWDVDEWWRPGHQIELGERSLWLLFTPGHTSDSISLWDPSNRLLFSGDYIYPGYLYGFLPNSNMYDYQQSAETLLNVLPEGTRLLGAHRYEAPGAPVLQWSDLVDLSDGLQGIKDKNIVGQGSYPQNFRINDNMVMLAEPRWLQKWQSSALTPPVSVSDADLMRMRIEGQMHVSDRHTFDLPRDVARKPYESFAFLGIHSGMAVLDVGAYAGYTTEMLSAAVGKNGKVYSHNTKAVLERFADGYYKRTMTERLANNRLPNTTLLVREHADLGLSEEIDVAFLGNLLHDFYHQEGREQAVKYLSEIRRALKPGGILGITDHVGNPGADNSALHRIDVAVARDLIIAAGFEIDAESDLFVKSNDNHTLMVYDERVYRQTDRFFIKAINPVGQ